MTRLYWSTTIYDRLDRMKLAELVAAAGHHLDLDELALETRADLIDLLVDTAVEAEDEAEGAGDAYPLRRPVRTEVPAWWGRGRLHLRWARDWERELSDLRDREDGAVPADATGGDVVLTVLGTSPAIAAVIARVGSDGHGYSDVVVVGQPVTWRQVIDDPEPRERLRFRDGPLDRGDARAVRAGLRRELERPSPVFVTAGACVWGGRDDSAVDASALLQQVASEGIRGSLRCAVCDDTEDRVELHFDRPLHEAVQLEIQDHVDDVAFVCADCHRLAHPHSIKAQRDALHRRAVPPCPACGARQAQRVVVGMVPDMDDEDAIYHGCVIDGPVMPQWKCSGCEDLYAVVSTTQVADLVSPGPMPTL